MATVFWYKTRNPKTGEMEEAPRKATEEAIAIVGGEKIVGSAEEVDEHDLQPGGFYESPYTPEEVRERAARDAGAAHP